MKVKEIRVAILHFDTFDTFLPDLLAEQRHFVEESTKLQEQLDRLNEKTETKTKEEEEKGKTVQELQQQVDEQLLQIRFVFFIQRKKKFLIF
jgi:hypothetical protein